MSPLLNMLPISIICCIGVSIVIIGYSSWRYLLNQNACNMTYSKIERKEVKVNSAFIEAKLYFYKNEKTTKIKKSNKKSKYDWDLKLAPYPILFIPGHGGK